MEKQLMFKIARIVLIALAIMAVAVLLTFVLWLEIEHHGQVTWDVVEALPMIILVSFLLLYACLRKGKKGK